MKLKLKLFLKRNYKKIIVPFICILLSFLFVLSASAIDTFDYNLWKYFSYGNYIVDFETGYSTISARISNHNPNVPNAILGYNVANIQPENGLTQFYLNVYLDTNTSPIIYNDDVISLEGSFISNFSMFGANGLPCTLTLKSVAIHGGHGSVLSTSAGTNLPVIADDVNSYTYFANFPQVNSAINNIRLVRFFFVLDRPAYSSGWGTHELQFSLSFNNSIPLKIYRKSKAEQPIYSAPDDSTLDSALGLEDNLLDEVGGNLEALDGLLSSANVEDDSVKKPITSFTYIFNNLFSRDNNIGYIFGRILRFSLAVGMSGFVLNIVVSMVSHFSAHNRDGTNNPKGGGK